MEEGASIIIRTLNESEALLDLVVAIARQRTKRPLELIVVDNESADRTAELAVDLGARLITIPRDDFSFPHSLNIGAQAARFELLVFLVGHALPFYENWLEGGLRHFEDLRIGGVYSPVIPRQGASFAEVLFYYPGYILAKLFGPYVARAGGMGVFGATNIAMRRSDWCRHPFDERYGLGGEDAQMALWLESQGKKIICDALFSVRHSHGLGWRGLWHQVKYWQRLNEPSEFNRKALAFRNDLDFSE